MLLPGPGATVCPRAAPRSAAPRSPRRRGRAGPRRVDGDDVVAESAARLLQRDGLRQRRRRWRPGRRPRARPGRPRRDQRREPDGSGRDARRELHAHGESAHGAPAVRPQRRRAHLRRPRAGNRAARARGRPRRGDAAERGRERGRDDPLARGRGAERRGRRRRRDPGRGRAGRPPRLPLPRRAGRDVLVPHAPGLGERGTARPLRRLRRRTARVAGRGLPSTSHSRRTPSAAPRPSAAATCCSGAQSLRARR